MSKPTNKPGWNPSDPSKVVEPSSTKKTQGWAAGEKPTAEHFNWLMKTLSQWVDYVDTAGVQGPKGDAGPAGPAGPAGADGAVGPAGPAGSVDTATLNTINSRLTSLESATGIASSSVTINFPYNGGAAPGEYDAGAVLPGNSKTIDWANGASQYLLLDANCNISFTNAVAGNTYYLRVQQGGYGNKIAGFPENVSWSGNAVPVISVQPWKLDVIGLYYNGAQYFGFVSQNHFFPPSGVDKNGYIAGGVFGNGTTTVAVGNVDKINFNSDQTISTIHTTFGRTLAADGSFVYPLINTGTGSTPVVRIGQGTQSAQHGYRIAATYVNLPTLPNTTVTSASHKMSFANDTDNIITLRFSANWALIPTGSTTNNIQKAVIQSSSNAYFQQSSGTVTTQQNIGKLQFSTDASSNIVASGPNLLASGQIFNSHGISGSTSGIFWGTSLGGAPGVNGHKMVFATDTSVTATTFVLPAASTLSGMSEAIDGEYKGYYTRGTGTSSVPTTTAYVTDKSVEGWNTLLTVLSQAGSGSAATQGLNAGYFCGHLNNSGAASNFLNTAPSFSQIKKMEFSSDAFSVHGASLNQARHLACGFEG